MVSFAPAALREANAAAYLDLSVSKFRNLVNNGALPKPVRLADGVERWRSNDLLAILDGKADQPRNEDME